MGAESARESPSGQLRVPEWFDCGGIMVARWVWPPANSAPVPPSSTFQLRFSFTGHQHHATHTGHLLFFPPPSYAPCRGTRCFTPRSHLAKQRLSGRGRDAGQCTSPGSRLAELRVQSIHAGQRKESNLVAGRGEQPSPHLGRAVSPITLEPGSEPNSLRGRGAAGLGPNCFTPGRGTSRSAGNSSQPGSST
ncbi:hypothetical protein Droror1_Dr00005726 [Drosera rotundifolia]